MSVLRKLKRQGCSKDVKLTWFRAQISTHYCHLYQVVPPSIPLLEVHKTTKKAKQRPELSAVRKAARLEATRKHRWENEEALREKARVRMAAHRQAIKDSGCVSEEQAERIKKAHAAYRAKHQPHLAFKQRLRRQDLSVRAFIAKHGIEAHRARIAEATARANAVLPDWYNCSIHLLPKAALLVLFVIGDKNAHKPNRNRTSRKQNPPTTSASTFVFNVADLVTPLEAASMASYVDHASADGHSIVRETLPKVPNPKRLEPSDKSMNHWMRLLRDIFLMQLLRRDGCSDASSELCPGCADVHRPPRYRCQECAGGLLLCQECCLDKHVEHPLHVISEWNGIFFAKTSLRHLGLRIQFGHAPREACGNPQPGYSEFVVLHDNGIHSVHVDFCGCDSQRRDEPYIQLLQGGWYPATDERPQTAATFLMLNKFHEYGALIRVNWRLTAPVCPNPKINLPEGWENAPAEDWFLYILFIALDACFRLKRHMISSEIKDPGLGTGWAYVTENPPYRHYLLTVTEQKEMSTCSGLAALDYVNTKFSRGYSTTGVGMGVCARHKFVQANGVGDLQKGERFANMDYIFGSILRHKDPRIRKIISYDIVCQWWKFLMERMQKLPPLVPCTSMPTRWTVKSNSLSILYRGVGRRTEKELSAPGRASGLWPAARASAGLELGTMPLTTTGRSGTGSRPLAYPLNPKTQLICYRRRLDNAKNEAASQRAVFEAFSLEQMERVPAWKKMVDDFEKHLTSRNPYELKITGLTEMEVRLQFAKEEEEDARKGVLALHDVSPSGFVTAGLELEEEQRRVRVQAELKKAGSTSQQINMKAMRAKLNRGITRFRQLQSTYSPAAIQVLAKRPAAAAEELAENVPLILPSSLTAAEREDGGCAKGILEIEDSLRAAQCHTALPRLRRQLHVKSRLLLYKKHNSRHQGMNTRSRTIVARNESKIRLHSEKFQMAWQARLLIADAEELSRNAEKRRRAMARREVRETEMRADGLLPQLDDDDDDEMVMRGGENVQQVSWIWTMAGTAGTEEELKTITALRIEWSKAWARSRRWTEEVRLLEEEWRRLPVTYAHREQLWKDRAVAVPVTKIPEAVAEGMLAYAMKPAQLYRDLAAQAETARTEAKLARGKKRGSLAALVGPVNLTDTGRAVDAQDGISEGGEDGVGSEDDEDDDEGRQAGGQQESGGAVGAGVHVGTLPRGILGAWWESAGTVQTFKWSPAGQEGSRSAVEERVGRLSASWGVVASRGGSAICRAPLTFCLHPDACEVESVGSCEEILRRVERPWRRLKPPAERAESAAFGAGKAFWLHWAYRGMPRCGHFDGGTVFTILGRVERALAPTEATSRAERCDGDDANTLQDCRGGRLGGWAETRLYPWYPAVFRGYHIWVSQRFRIESAVSCRVSIRNLALMRWRMRAIVMICEVKCEQVMDNNGEEGTGYTARTDEGGERKLLRIRNPVKLCYIFTSSWASQLSPNAPEFTTELEET
ncbi:hypothetical protein B0H14DRAFT_2631029 [Mycena olivaceomarginata]|nr:hypothetical protein B0H14DRAFT_2631029 [Mycena olivaceomarginata]